MDESKVIRYATENYVNDSLPVNTISSKVLATVPASNVNLQDPITINNVSINKDRRYYIEFLGSKKLCKLLISEETGNFIICNIGNYTIQIISDLTDITIYIAKNTTDTTTDTFTDLIIYEEEVKYLDNKYLETNLVLQNSISLGRIGNIGVGSNAIGMAVMASGNYSHAEGDNTIASGNLSHAEGTYTKASSQYQHVQGKYNIEDKANKYAHIVGNGASDSNRSNAHTLDWQGNAWYAGKLTVGKDPTDDMDVVTKKYFDANKGSGGSTIDTSNFVKKEAGKGLSTNDLTNALKSNYDTAYAHSQAAHAPSTAQKNSDITKAEIEAKLTGDVTSHTHSQYLTEHQSLDGYATKNNPVFTGSVSSGRKEGTTVGENSFAVGSNVEASGVSSHAEGGYTVASGDYSHVEGNYSKATNNWSHAEGFTTTASGKYSHAEGNYTTASGESSHSEGSYSKATSDWSHAEGYHTNASSNYQHVQGKFNIEDTANKYAHIVGNGTTNLKRSNAHTLDWQGNAWYSGKLSQEGIPTEDKDLVTKKYVDDKFENINLGPYSIQYNNENNRLEFIYTPPATE